jgi:hypothetical protein
VGDDPGDHWIGRRGIYLEKSGSIQVILNQDVAPRISDRWRQ